MHNIAFLIVIIAERWAISLIWSVRYFSRRQVRLKHRSTTKSGVFNSTCFRSVSQSDFLFGRKYIPTLIDFVMLTFSNINPFKKAAFDMEKKTFLIIRCKINPSHSFWRTVQRYTLRGYHEVTSIFIPYWTYGIRTSSIQLWPDNCPLKAIMVVYSKNMTCLTKF